MAELVDAPDLGSGAYGVGVRVPSPDFNLVKFKRNVFQFSLVYHLFVGAPVIEISVSHWVGHFLAAIPNAFLSSR